MPQNYRFFYIFLFHNAVTISLFRAFMQYLWQNEIPFIAAFGKNLQSLWMTFFAFFFSSGRKLCSKAWYVIFIVMQKILPRDTISLALV